MIIEHLYVFQPLVQHDPCRKITITPKVIKTLSNGTEIITYYWEGAEVAEIMTNKLYYAQYQKG